MKDQRINIGNIELQIREYKQDGDAIIFLHFGGGNLMMWQGIVPFFQEDYHLVLFDLRGHGKSDKPQKGYHIDEMAQDVFMVMKNLQIEQAHIVGSSLGAEVGLSIAANYPDMALSLVCEGALYSEFGPYGLWKGSEAEFKEHAAQTLKKIRNTPEKVFPSVDALVDESRKGFEKRGWWSEIFEAVKRYDAIKIGEGKYTDSWGKMAEEYTKNYLYYRFEDYYRLVKCPVLIMPDVYPGQDEREKEVMHGLFKLLDQGKIVSIPEWMHPFGWMLTPEAGSKAVLEFLAEVRNRTGELQD
ncbi:MAG: alpha/beta hydrolase [Chloroflexi bacterium]|nr:alpha/beta hydrolase [Chloroflexota bacterium]